MTERPGREGKLRGLLGSGEPELTCEGCFEELDRYVDLARTGADAELEFPGMRAHLEGCPACAEDFESLRALVDEEPASPE